MVSISIVDFVGKVKDGIGVVLSMNIDDTIYQMIFWFNKECKYVLTVDDSLLKVLNVKTIYEYEHLEELLRKIFLALPPVKEMFEKYEI